MKTLILFLENDTVLYELESFAVPRQGECITLRDAKGYPTDYTVTHVSWTLDTVYKQYLAHVGIYKTSAL